MQPFLAILAEEETASVMESPAFYSGELGVTRLGQPWQCGHLFCRRELRFSFEISLSFRYSNHSFILVLSFTLYLMSKPFSLPSPFLVLRQTLMTFGSHFDSFLQQHHEMD